MGDRKAIGSPGRSTNRTGAGGGLADDRPNPLNPQRTVHLLASCWSYPVQATAPIRLPLLFLGAKPAFFAGLRLAVRFLGRLMLPSDGPPKPVLAT